MADNIVCTIMLVNFSQISCGIFQGATTIVAGKGWMGPIWAIRVSHLLSSLFFPVDFKLLDGVFSMMPRLKMEVLAAVAA